MNLPEKKRRRTCIDRLRRDLAKRQRQRRGSDPAGGAILQLLGILSAGLALLPPLPEVSFASGRLSRKVASSPPGGPVPAYSDDEDRGPTAWAMERGIDLPHYPTTSRGAPSWSRLVKDLKRRSTGPKARALIEKRVPPEAVEWLRCMICLEDWQTLRQLGRDGAGDDDIAAAALVEAKRWKAAQSKSVEPALPDTENPDTASDDLKPKGPK